MAIVRSAWIVVALAVAGCAGTAAAPQHARTVAPARTVRAHGLTAELPPGWQAARLLYSVRTERRRRRSSSSLSQWRAHDFSSARAGCSSLPMAVSP